MKKQVISLLFALLVATVGSTAQVINITSFFKATETQGKTILSWQMVVGSTCNGIQIYRGTDSTLLTQIGEIIGVCGSLTEPVDYSFVDDKLTENTTYFYRLEFGTQGFSSIIAVNVNGIFNGASQVRPNPISQSGTIFFSKSLAQSHKLTVYSQYGQKVVEKTTTESTFTINALGLKNGLYTYTILSDEQLLIATDKFLVLK